MALPQRIHDNAAAMVLRYGFFARSGSRSTDRVVLPRVLGALIATTALLTTACGGSVDDGLFISGAGTSAGGSRSAGAAGSSGDAGTGNTGNSGNGGSGNTGNTGSGGSGNTGNTGNGSPFPCDNPEPVKVLGQETGTVRCANGMVHRAQARDCPARPQSGEPIEFCTETSGSGQCHTDFDCRQAPLGFCRPANAGIPMCACIYGCVSDSDCGHDQICRCGDPVGQCVPANCTDNSDCDGRLCVEYQIEPFCGGPAYACQTMQDKCGGDGDCTNGEPCTRESMGPSFCTDEMCAFASAPPGTP